jgi:hypothetical protein
MAMISASCVKLLAEANYDPNNFGSFEAVDQEIKRAKQKVAAYRDLSPEERLANQSAKPTKDEWKLAHGEPQLLGYKPKRCTQQNPAGVAEGAAVTPGSEAEADGGATAGGGAPGASAGGALADRETEKPKLAARQGDRASSDRALAPEASARPAPDEGIGTAARAGGISPPASGPKEKGPAKAHVEGRTASECLESLRQADFDTGKRTFPKATAPAERGMRDKDDAKFRQLAKKEIILVRESNPAALDRMPGGRKSTPHDGLKGGGCTKFSPKPEKVKGKTLKPGKDGKKDYKDENEGLAAIRQKDYRKDDQSVDVEKYQEDRAKLERKGYKVLDDQDGVVVGPTGEAFYSDYDLHGTYDTQGKNTWYDGREEHLAPQLDEDQPDLIQHGPHDRWPRRLYHSWGGKNAGPQPPVTAYTPDGEPVALTSVADMKAFYAQNCIEWPYSSDQSTHADDMRQ